MLSVLDIFRIGIGPSSSHTVGPMRIARTFVRALRKAGKLDRTARITVELQGSLALTGVGHGTVNASMLGLMGFAPDSTCPDEAAAALATDVPGAVPDAVPSRAAPTPPLLTSCGRGVAVCSLAAVAECRRCGSGAGPARATPRAVEGAACDGRWATRLAGAGRRSRA